MPTITVTVVEHAATERKPWRVTAHDGTHRFTMPVIVGQPMAVTVRAVAGGLTGALNTLLPIGSGGLTIEPRTPSRHGHRRYWVTY